MLFPTASIQNHHKFKLSVIKQPELPSQLSPLRYRPEGTPGSPVFLSRPPSRAPRAPHGSSGPRPGPRPSRPALGRPLGGPGPRRGRAPPQAPRGEPRAEPQGRKEGRGWAQLEQGGQRRHPAAFSFHQTPAPGSRSKPALPEQNAVLPHRAGPSPAVLHRRGRATPQALSRTA